MTEFPWYSKYPAGTLREIGPLSHTSLIDLFEDASKKFADRVAFENMGVKLTYREVDEKATAFAAYLQSLGLRKGDRIAIQMPNLLQFPIAFTGALKAGLIVVNTNPLYTPREMEYQFKDAGVSAIVILSNFAHHLAGIRDKVPAKHIIITDMGDMLGTIKGSVINLVVKYLKKLVPPFHIPGALSFKTALKLGASMSYQRPAVDVEDLAVLQYTGGTTGIAKGAQLSHRNIIAHNQMISEWFKPYLRADGKNIIITAIPMYHIFALTVNGTLMYSVGVKNVLITNPRDIPGFCKELTKHKFTIITGVNTLFNSLLNNPHFKNIDFSSLKGAVAGAMAVSYTHLTLPTNREV